MIECAAHTGADLFVTSPSRQPFDRSCVEILKKAGITFIEPGTARGEFDFVIDTAADLIDSVRAKKCLVEDTRSGSFLYEAKAKNKALNLAPIVSFDESRLKQIEDLLGVGDGYKRGLEHFLGEVPQGAKVLIIGGGKVGSGIAYSVSSFATKISIVDLYPEKVQLLKAIQDKIKVFSPSEIIKNPKLIEEFNYVVTVTARAETMTKFYPKSLFAGKFLANMGAEDEWGSAYTENEVLNKKKLLNFSLDEPTLLKYLDPGFAAMIQTLIENKTSQYSAFQGLPESIDKSTLSYWLNTHRNDLNKLELEYVESL